MELFSIRIQRTFQLVSTWVAGKRHIYTLIFGGGYTDQGEAVLNPIQFNAETTEWVDANSNVNVKP